ncbi:MAG: hypothetical protein HYX86_00770 [Chloroflexi bacterium]|nr:hypothetical protein [Chloroflexota bacterium]
MPGDKKDNARDVIGYCPYCKAGISDEVGIIELVESKYSLRQWTNTDLLDSETEVYFCLNCRNTLTGDLVDKLHKRLARMKRKEMRR